MRMAVVILAAGEGKRMRKEGSPFAGLPKVLVPFRGKPMIKWLIRVVEKSQVFDKVVIVAGFMADKVKAVLGPRFDYALQERQLGTAHALLCAKPNLQGQNDIAVLSGDMPCLTAEVLEKLADVHKKEECVLTMATCILPDFNGWRKPFWNFGRIVRTKDGEIERIVELKDAKPAEQEIKEVNPNIFCFKNDWLWENLEKIHNKNAQKEYYLTDLVEIARKQGKQIASFQVDPKFCLGINSFFDLEQAEKLLAN